MSLTLGQAETRLRLLTQHTADLRLSQPAAWICINDAYKSLRMELRAEDFAPTLYLKCSEEMGPFEDVDLPDYNEISLADDDDDFDSNAMVERKSPNGDRFYGIDKADSVDPTNTRNPNVSFTIAHRCLRLHHPSGKTGGTYRVWHWITPPDLADVNAYFLLPASLEGVLVIRAAAMVALIDRSAFSGAQGVSKGWLDLADLQLKRIKPVLAKQYGWHMDQGGMKDRRVALTWTFKVLDKTIEELVFRLDRLIEGLGDSVRRAGDAPIQLTAGTARYRHLQRRVPRSAFTQVEGSTASSAVVTVGEITEDFVTISATSGCSVSLYLVM